MCIRDSLRLRRYKQILVQVGAFQREVSHFEPKFQVERDVAPNHCWGQKTTVFLLPHSEDRMISSFVWIGYQRVTDRQTDGRTDAIAVVSAVKIRDDRCLVCYNCRML